MIAELLTAYDSSKHQTTSIVHTLIVFQPLFTVVLWTFRKNRRPFSPNGFGCSMAFIMKAAADVPSETTVMKEDLEEGKRGDEGRSESTRALPVARAEPMEKPQDFVVKKTGF